MMMRPNTTMFFFVCAQNGESGKEMDDDKDANKSEISLVFEIALKRNMPVSFEVCVHVLFYDYLSKLDDVLYCLRNAHAFCVKIHYHEISYAREKWKLS